MSLSAVSAADTNITISDNNGTSISDVSTVSANADTNISTGSFTDLANKLNNDTNGTIKLDRNYTYNPNTDFNYLNGINITNKTIDIDGNDYIINGNNQSGILNIQNSTVYLSDLTFTNANTNLTDYVGGAISIQNSNVNIHYCDFEDNTMPLGGGAIAAHDSNLTISGSNFINNKAKMGGAIDIHNTTLYISDTYFVDNNAGYGGAIYSFKSSVDIDDSTEFNNNSAIVGGAILSDTSKLNITDETEFVDNNATLRGGAIYSTKDTINIDSSYFYNNFVLINNRTNNTSLVGGGVIYMNNGNLTVTENIFRQSTVDGDGFNINGGVLNLNHCIVTINANTFSNNYAKDEGNVIYANDTSLNLTKLYISNEKNNEGLISINNSNMNLTYSTILNNNTEFIALTNSSGSLNYNWWGTNNNPNRFVKSDNTSNSNLTNWVILTLSSNATNLTVNQNINVTTSLTHYTDGNNTYDMTIPVAPGDRDFDIIVTNSTGNSTYDRYFKHNINYFNLLFLSSGDRIITVKLDNQTLSLNITVNKMTNMSSILNTPETWYFYGYNSYTGTLKDSNGNGLYLKTVSLNLTRISTGAWKVYNVTTKRDGSFTLPITLAPGEYSVKGVFNGTKDYYSSEDTATFIVYNYILNVRNINKTYGNNISFNGTLTYANNTPVVNYTILIQLVRLGDGANKVYNLTTDENGFFSLPINLSPGNYLSITFSPDGTFYTKNYICINNETSDNRTITSTLTYTNSSSLSGNLYDYKFKAIPNQNVTIELTRASNGLSKNYTVTTDNDGYYTLPLNLASGYYKLHTFYAGTSVYQPCAYQLDFPFRIVNY